MIDPHGRSAYQKNGHFFQNMDYFTRSFSPCWSLRWHDAMGLICLCRSMSVQCLKEVEVVWDAKDSRSVVVLSAALSLRIALSALRLCCILHYWMASLLSRFWYITSTQGRAAAYQACSSMGSKDVHAPDAAYRFEILTSLSTPQIDQALQQIKLIEKKTFPTNEAWDFSKSNVIKQNTQVACLFQSWRRPDQSIYRGLFCLREGRKSYFPPQTLCSWTISKARLGQNATD